MINPKANALLQKTEQAARAKANPQEQAQIQKIVQAGLVIMDSDKTHQMVVSQLKTGTEPAAIAGNSVAKLMGILRSQSKGTMPMRPMMLAAIVLLCEALDRLEALGKVVISQDVITQATQDLYSSVLQLFGVTPDKLDEIVKKSQGQKAQAAQPPQGAMPPAPPPQNQPQALIGAPQ